MKIKISFVVALMFFVLSFKSAFAVDVPNFPACSNPQGALIVSYDSGIHGVAGGNSYTGSDKVYKIDENSLVQCLCTADGKGIQTNWWKASSLDVTQITTLKSEGWIYIPTGSVWGLDQDAYLAKNIGYSCISDSGTGGGSIGQVLGLAFTGNIKVIYSIFILGLLFLIYGQILHRARN
jgi:hypothetical protein